MSQLHENKPVESKVTEWLTQLGWEYRSAEDLKSYNRLQMNAVVEPILVELGPGGVLSGLVRRTDRGLRCMAVEDRESLAALAGPGSDVG